MNIIISGLTAAGKTTHSFLLSQRYNLKVVSAAALMAKASGVQFSVAATESSFWISEGAKKLAKLRTKDNYLDLAVDAELKRLAEQSDNIVFDACGLPWLTTAPALRIWLESTLDSRVLKSLVSHRNDKYNVESELLKFIKKKDRETREIFLSLYSFDVYRDHQVFDLIIDISSLICKPHILSAKKSIRVADKIISSVVGWCLERTEEHKLAFKKCLSEYDRKIFVKYPSDIGE
jgi:CMP/dCMP kinase